MPARIMWLASYPKSGNTWLRAFLMHFFTNAHEQQALDDLSQFATFDSTAGFYNKAIGEVRERWTEADTAALRVAVQRQISKGFSSTGFVKTHSAFMPWHDEAMFDISLIAGAVYIVRNPLDVVASLAPASGQYISDTIKMMNTTDFVWPVSKIQVPQLLGSWSQNVETWTSNPDPTLHVMRYEDLIHDPLVTFGKLVKFLKVEAPPGLLERAVEFASFDRLSTAEKESGFRERTPTQDRFFRRGQIDGWRHELTADQVRDIVDCHRIQMARFGYVPDSMQ